MIKHNPPCLSKTLIWLLALCLGLRFASLGLYPLMDTTEARYGEMARIMFETGNWVTPMFDYGIPFWGKPPLFTWLSSLGFAAFGVNEFAVRIPHLLVGIGIIALLYQFARDEYKNKTLGLSAAAVLASTTSFILLSGAVMTDTALTFSISLSMISFWQAWNGKNKIWGYLFFVGLALGMLSKGPLAIVLVGISLTLWLIPNGRWKHILHRLPWGYGSALMIIIALPWYLIAEHRTPGFLNYFLVGEHIKRFIVSGWQGDLYGSAHERARGTIWIYAFLAMLPWSPLLICQWIRNLKENRDVEQSENGITSFLLLWMLAPMLLFSFAGNILASYVMPALPPMALLLTHLHQQHPLPNRLYKIGFFTPLLLIGLVSALHFQWVKVKSEHNLLKQWQEQTEAGQSDLFYLHKRPFSGQYYSAGRAKKRSTDIHTWLPDQSKTFFIVQAKDDHTHYPRWSCQERGQSTTEKLLFCQP
ncbi:ArnT family glycosyltransferase [Marinomonas posidonica]|uniref:Glycosyl transferase family 39 n=1 Tax=Marinomonas posidonica (strain CECT 7376 / NCIMB 14433 / IVIA-Po-181) TaxID=491952 RepID=F6CX96_MARPP|nr:glycosyltransferase family 39 protein [Marinomonas posidonica]AEF54449.1 glycosyl transferase family 39 [Marinomonas posidonica IVIA-Po-181]